MHLITQRLIATLFLSLLIVPVSGVISSDGSQHPGAAWAQDSDDDDDSDDDSGDDDSGDDGSDDNSDDYSDDDDYRNGGSGNDWDRRPRRQQTVSQPSPPPPLNAPDEVVVTDLAPETLAILQGEGFTLIAEEQFGNLGLAVTRLSVPAGLGLEAARARVRALPGGEDADFNHFYRPEQSGDAAACAPENCAALDLISWPVERPETCRVTLPVGMIDTGVNAAHDILTGARLDVVRMADAGLDPSAAVHGTAVASLLIGTEGSRVPGLIREAEVIAVDVFSKEGSDERADVTALLRGLDVLNARGVRVMNLSLAGPENGVLDAALDRMTGPEGSVIVAAAGNAGPDAPPAWPAAHPGVLAVTAVDARGRVYRGAQRGGHIDLAAPGVGLLAATSIRGARGKTGTSYAVPFVTAAAAVMLSQDPTLTPAMVAERLKARARDIGAEGPDEVFGAGLLDTATLCSDVQTPTE